MYAKLLRRTCSKLRYVLDLDSMVFSKRNACLMMGMLSGKVDENGRILPQNGGRHAVRCSEKTHLTSICFLLIFLKG